MRKDNKIALTYSITTLYLFAQNFDNTNQM